MDTYLLLLPLRLLLPAIFLYLHSLTENDDHDSDGLPNLHGLMICNSRVLKPQTPRWTLPSSSRRAPQCLDGNGPSFSELKAASNSFGRGQVDLPLGCRWVEEKMARDGHILNHGFNCSFLSPRSSLELESGTYQLISLRVSIWYICMYFLYLVSFAKRCIFWDTL